jgi:hypothetical protein
MKGRQLGLMKEPGCIQKEGVKRETRSSQTNKTPADDARLPWHNAFHKGALVLNQETPSMRLPGNGRGRTILLLQNEQHVVECLWE